MREFKRAKPEFTVFNPKRLYRRDDIFLATPDRLLCIGATEAHAVLEIKNTEYWSKDKRTAMVTMAAAYQVQWYLMVLDMKFGYICAMEKGWHIQIQPILRDEELITRMKETAEAFWENVILQQKLPPSSPYFR